MVTNMKKNIFIFILILSLIFITGCGDKSKTLECNKEIKDESGFKIEEKYSYEFKGNKLVEFSVDKKVVPNKKELNEFLSLFSANVDKKFEDFKGKKGIDYTSDIKYYLYTLRISVNYKNIDANEFSNVNDTIKDIVSKKDQKVSLKQTKDEMEKDNYTCKEK